MREREEKYKNQLEWNGIIYWIVFRVEGETMEEMKAGIN